MRFLHISDLHLGKRAFGTSFLEDQAYILEKIALIAADAGAQLIVIAGDIYDRPLPPAEAVSLFDAFICRVKALGMGVVAISGNHDSPERLAFGSSIMAAGGIYFSPVYSGAQPPLVFEDEYGKVYFYSLPFIKPASLRPLMGAGAPATYDGAVRAAVRAMDIDQSQRNVMISHQFVTGSSQAESEELLIGGLENVDADVYSAFDYTALGHIHRAQSVGVSAARYSGSPLKYSFSKNEGEKSAVLVELAEKGVVSEQTIPLEPLKDMRTLKGTLEAMLAGAKGRQDYIRAVITDDLEDPFALEKLRDAYPNLLCIEYDNARTRAAAVEETLPADPESAPDQLMERFFELRNNKSMTKEQRDYMLCEIRKIWGYEE